MDLSKAFDSINHELLIAKLHAYGLKSVLSNYFSTTFQIDGNAQK